MPKWTDYTTKTEPADNDEVMVLDTAGKANKRLGLSALSDWIIGKIANKVFENLQTQNKTILGALNELNSKTLKIINAQSNEFEISAEGTSTITITADFEGFIPLVVVNIYSLSSDTYIANRYGLSPTTAIVKNISSEYARKTTIFVQYLCIK